jgi:hypothetical protein
MNFADTIKTKSDQLNADDFLGKDTMTITITKVECKDSQDQPVAIHYEGGQGKPYKPCLSMRKIIIHAWGGDETKFIGRSLLLYRDPNVKWAGEAVGGIRIKAMSNIPEKLQVALQVSRMKRQIVEIEKLNTKDPLRERAEKYVNDVLAGSKEKTDEAVEMLKKDFPDLLKKLEETTTENK